MDCSSDRLARGPWRLSGTVITIRARQDRGDETWRCTTVIVGVAVALLLALPTRALAQESLTATVTRVIDGDTVEARLSNGAIREFGCSGSTRLSPSLPQRRLSAGLKTRPRISRGSCRVAQSS